MVFFWLFCFSREARSRSPSTTIPTHHHRRPQSYAPVGRHRIRLFRRRHDLCRVLSRRLHWAGGRRSRHLAVLGSLLGSWGDRYPKDDAEYDDAQTELPKPPQAIPVCAINDRLCHFFGGVKSVFRFVYSLLARVSSFFSRRINFSRHATKISKKINPSSIQHQLSTTVRWQSGSEATRRSLRGQYFRRALAV